MMGELLQKLTLAWSIYVSTRKLHYRKDDHAMRAI